MKQLTKDHFTKLLTAITEQHKNNRRIMEGLYQAFPTANPAALLPDISIIEISVTIVLQALANDKMALTSDYIEASMRDKLPLNIHIGHAPVVISNPNELWDAIEALNMYYA